MRKPMKIELLKAIDTVIRNYDGDEELIFWWLQEGVPDCAQDDDYEFIASDRELFDETIQLFIDIVKQFE